MIEYCELNKEETIDDENDEYCEIIEYCKVIEDKEDNDQLIEDKNNAHQSIKQIIESCELIEDQEDINKLNEYSEIIFNNAHQLIKEIIESCELIEDQEGINKLNEYLEIIFNKTVETKFNESPFKSLISDIRSILLEYRRSKLKKNVLNILEA